MRLEHDGYEVAVLDYLDGAPIDISLAGATGTEDHVTFDRDSARWLAFVAIPAALATPIEDEDDEPAESAEVPSDLPAMVRPTAPDEGQIPGQLAID